MPLRVICWTHGSACIIPLPPISHVRPSPPVSCYVLRLPREGWPDWDDRIGW